MVDTFLLHGSKEILTNKISVFCCCRFHRHCIDRREEVYRPHRTCVFQIKRCSHHFHNVLIALTLLTTTSPQHKFCWFTVFTKSGYIGCCAFKRWNLMSDEYSSCWYTDDCIVFPLHTLINRSFSISHSNSKLSWSNLRFTTLVVNSSKSRSRVIRQECHSP